MPRKLQAIRCYRSQLTAFRYDDAVEGLNRFRGCLAARCRYAEVFRYIAPDFPTSLDRLPVSPTPRGNPG
jgi:hypothetical protein